ncbi:HTH_Tnp_Tc3_2 domain-containing protein [Trichonephila clavipes]|uniref:HTH_Tnp_Tc3_2 domain-containing protein n=2 Tax=Trichonephila TaxID=2585208 RepID=A0A8X7BLT6_TRICX|nr:HTH_Tnp_Tc3_2 domain-containing protein [Trichonephila clavipes]
MRTREDQNVYPIAPHTITQVMGKYVNEKCTLPMWIHQDAAKHGYGHLDAVNRTWIHLKILRFSIQMSRFVVDCTIEETSVCDTASRVAVTMVFELRVHSAVNVIELFVQTLVVLQTTSILDSGLKTWLHDPLSQSFSRLKSSKRQFYVLDDRHWRLFFYRCEEDFRSSKPPLGSIALSEAAINLTSSEDVHQFVVQNSSESDPDKWLFTSIPKRNIKIPCTCAQKFLITFSFSKDRYLAVTAKRNRRSTASDLSRQLSLATGTKVSRQTMHRRLGHIGLYARRTVRCVPLTETYSRLRLTWSREHALWTPQQWSCVMFSDDSRFSLQSDSRRTFIWKAPGTRYHQENTIERHRYGGAGWLVWGGELFLVPELTCMFRV